MFDANDARAVAEAHLDSLSKKCGHELVLLLSSTREEDFGWVFFFNTRAYVETGDINDALGGNGPLIVDRASGQLHEGGTAYPLEHYIRVFKRDGNLMNAHK